MCACMVVLARWGGREPKVSNFIIDALSGTPKLPKNVVKYFFPQKMKSHAIEG